MAGEHLAQKATFRQGPEGSCEETLCSFWGIEGRAFFRKIEGQRETRGQNSRKGEKALFIVPSPSSFLTNEVSLTV